MARIPLHLRTIKTTILPPKAQRHLLQMERKRFLLMMKGNMWKFLLLKISFIPGLLFSIVLIAVSIYMPSLSLLSLVGGIMILRIVPQLKMAEVFFYRDLIGDYDSSGDESLEKYNGYMGNMFDNSNVVDNENVSENDTVFNNENDDYNAEA
jgi:hypothetical protein